ncbi:MAG: trans-aconitate 2-methyltransferase [Candidatus Pristimantibacillus sp.]
MMSSIQQWKPESYDNHLGYVSRLGQGILEWLNPQPNEFILDLGCGTGDLAFEIAQAGAKVIGLDYSESMITAAREKYPDIEFQLGNGEIFTTSQRMDAVFSNAALHWMKNPTKVIQSVWNSLNNGGRFVAEFGGKGNVDSIVKAIYEVMPRYGIDASERNPWYFPTIGEYSHLLEKQGFHVTLAEHFARPTELPDGEQGIMHWLFQFADSFISPLSDSDRNAALQEITQIVKHKLQDGDTIIKADYSRIRMIALKPHPIERPV